MALLGGAVQEVPDGGRDPGRRWLCGRLQCSEPVQLQAGQSIGRSVIPPSHVLYTEGERM